MELRQLRYFAEAARARNFTAAARACGVTQPSLSQQIAHLEEELGQPLFDRLPRAVALTDVGRQLLEHAQRVLAEVENAERAVRDVADNVAGVIRVGVIPTIAPYLMPKALRRFARSHSALRVELDEDVTANLVEKLNAGEVDLTIISPPIEHELVHVEPLFDEELVLAMPAGHRLSRKRDVRWDDLTDEPFMLLQDVHCLGQQTRRFCRRIRLDPKVVLYGSQIGTIQEMVAQGLGVSLLPAMAADADRSKRRTYRRLRQDPPHRGIAIAWNLSRYRTLASRALVEMMKRTAGR